MATRARQDRIDELFLDAVSLEPFERQQFLRQLDEMCDSTIVGELKKLLHADDARRRVNPKFLEAIPHRAHLPPEKYVSPGLLAGQQIGPYQVERLIDQGGFGEVYLAHRTHPFEQEVAIKKLGQHFAENEEVLRRFETERQVLAELVHDNIARLIDGGQDRHGCPYFVMEYVDGLAITDYCDSRQLGLSDRLRIFQKVCRTIAFAHQRGVIHRDLKPRNVLVTDDGSPKVLDFGIAKLTGSLSRHQKAATTRNGLLPFTPEYASPEQVRGKTVTTGSDIYALGALLYRLLTGSVPHDVSGKSPTEIECMICGQPPRYPSQAILAQWAPSQHGLAPPSSTSNATEQVHCLDRVKRSQALEGDLDRIVLKAMHKDPQRRYCSPDEMADDIQRYFDGLPVIAQPDSYLYRCRKFLQRNRLAVIAVALILTALAVGLGTTLRALAIVSRQKSVAIAALGAKERAAYNLQLARIESLIGRRPDRALAELEDEELCPPHLRDFTWRLYRTAALNDHTELVGHTDEVRCVAFSPTENLLASAGRGGKIRLWDVQTGQEKTQLLGHSDWINDLAFAPDGGTLASASRDNTVKLWDIHRREETVALRRHTMSVDGVAFSSNGQMVASAGRDRHLYLWDAASGKFIRDYRYNTFMARWRIRCAAFEPSGPGFAYCSDHGVIQLDRTGTNVFEGLTCHLGEDVLTLAFSPDGGLLASAAVNRSDRTVSLVVTDLRSQQSRQLLATTDRKHSNPINSVAFSADGRLLAFAGPDTAIRLWDLERNHETARLDARKGRVRQVAFSRDRKLLASACRDGTVRLWNIDVGPKPKRIETRHGLVYGLSYSADENFLASAGEDGTVKLWDVRSRRCQSALSGHRTAVRSVACSPCAPIVASGSYDGTIKLWEGRTGKTLATFEGHTDRVQSVAFSPDGSVLASGGRDARVRIWDVATHEELASLAGHRGCVTSVRFSPNGQHLATASRDRSVRLWHVASGAVRQIINTERALGAIAFSPDGSTLACGPARVSRTGGCDGTIGLWEMKSFQRLSECEGHTDEVFSIEFSSDGQTLASSGADNTVRLWDPKTGQQRAVFRDHANWIHSIAFSPDAQSLASAGTDIRIWTAADNPDSTPIGQLADSSTRLTSKNGSQFARPAPPHLVRERLALKTSGGQLDCITFSPDGSTFATSGVSQPINLWDTEMGERVALLPDDGAHVGTISFSPDKALLAAAYIQQGVRIWRIQDGALLQMFPDKRLSYVAFSPDGKKLAATGVDARIVVWDVGSWTKTVVRIMKDLHRCVSTAPIFSPDGKFVVCGTGDGSICALDATEWMDWTEQYWIEGLRSEATHLAFSPDGRFLAAGCRDPDELLLLWDLSTSAKPVELRGHTDEVRFVAFSPDGTLLVSSAPRFDDTVRFWDVASGREIYVLKGVAGSTGAIGWSPDGRTLVTPRRTDSGTKLIQLWDVDLQGLKNLARHPKQP